MCLTREESTIRAFGRLGFGCIAICAGLAGVGFGQVEEPSVKARLFRWSEDDDARVLNGDLIEASNAVVYLSNGAVQQADRKEFRVFFGSLQRDPNGNFVICPPGQVGSGRYESVNNELFWNIQAGFGLARGWRPPVRTTSVNAISNGTELLVQIDPYLDAGSPDDDIHRVILLSSGTVTVELNTGGPITPVKTLNQSETYVEVRRVNGQLQFIDDQVKTLEPAGPLRQFVKDVTSRPLAREEGSEPLQQP